MDKVYVIDFGGQYTHLIANRIRRLKVLAEIKHPDDDIESFKNAKGIILSGGPKSAYEADRPEFNKEVLNLNIPVLGLCFGHQLIVHELGGKVTSGNNEYGIANVEILKKEGIFKGLVDVEQVWMSHGDSVISLPAGFEVIAKTGDCPYAAIANTQKGIYGFQFHPEVTHTPNGMVMLGNFLDICSCGRDWTIKGFLSSAKESIEKQVKGRKVFMLVSGGVDSTVAFTMLNEILGEDRVLGLNIDNGFCRKNEVDDIERVMAQHGYHNLIMKDYSGTFLGNLDKVAEPERKRKIIGNSFIDVANEALAELSLNPDEWLLGQGTIYPDTIESGGTKNSATIKTHHNRVELIEDLIKKGLVVEPISQLYKDEVRELGLELGLPQELVWRHPFPGPGLAVRALCSDGVEDNPDYSVDVSTVELCKSRGFDVSVLPIRSVGVQGDSRTYAHPAVVYGKQDWRELEAVSTYITNKQKNINRVITLISPAKMPDLRLKEAYLTKGRLDILREADDIVMRFLHDEGLTKVVWQMPTVLLPLTSDGIKECVVLRPVITRDFMTARFAEIHWSGLNSLGSKIMGLGFFDAVFYDITHKPPGTIEWE